jgi:transposase
MTILIAFHQSHYRDFKTFYCAHVCLRWRSAFPRLVSYQRFIEFVPSVLWPLSAYLKSLLGTCSGITFADSTPLAVCDNCRIQQHKVFAATAKRGKTSTGWFFGFKLHLLVNDQGELLNLTLTTGQVDDRKPLLFLVTGLFGKVFADKGYISGPLADALRANGIELITKARKNMTPRPLSAVDRVLLRKRAIIESVIDQLKNISQIEHTRHRADTGFLWNLLGALIAYCHQPKKPSLNLKGRSGLSLP